MATSNYLQKNEKELETLLQTKRMYCQDIGMEFAIEKICLSHKEKWKKTKGIEQPYQGRIISLGEKKN